MFGKHERLERKLRERGRSAPAQVVSWVPTKMSLQSGEGASGRYLWQVFKVALRVSPEGGDSYDVEVTARYGGLNRPPAVGSTITVLYDPNDLSTVTIDTGQADSEAADLKKLLKTDPAAYARVVTEQALARAAGRNATVLKGGAPPPPPEGGPTPP